MALPGTITKHRTGQSGPFKNLSPRISEADIGYGKKKRMQEVR